MDTEEHIARFAARLKGHGPNFISEPLVFTIDAYVTTSLAVELCPVEIMVLKKVLILPNLSVKLYDPLIPPQTCSLIFTDNVYQPSAAQPPAESSDEVCWYDCWSHSHVRGAAYFSGTDAHTIRERILLLANTNPSPVVGPLVNLVWNKWGQMQAHFAFARPSVYGYFTRCVIEGAPSRRELEQYRAQRKPEVERFIRERVTILQGGPDE